MRAYAGIGSRTISDKEKETIHQLAKKLSERFVVYSGNANGADIAFQEGSNKKCVVFLPYAKFNIKNYNPWMNSIECFIKGDSPDGIQAARELHPAFHHLDWKSLPMMARNYHQIMGFGKYPIVDFVLCCADRDKKGSIIGGTGHACRIAQRERIPVINIRDTDWKSQLLNIIQTFIN